MDIFWLKSVSNFYNQIKLKVSFRCPLPLGGEGYLFRKGCLVWLLLASSFSNGGAQSRWQHCDTGGVHLHVSPQLVPADLTLAVKSFWSGVCRQERKQIDSKQRVDWLVSPRWQRRRKATRSSGEPKLSSNSWNCDGSPGSWFTGEAASKIDISCGFKN